MASIGLKIRHFLTKITFLKVVVDTHRHVYWLLTAENGPMKTFSKKIIKLNLRTLATPLTLLSWPDIPRFEGLVLSKTPKPFAEPVGPWEPDFGPRFGAILATEASDAVNARILARHTSFRRARPQQFCNFKAWKKFIYEFQLQQPLIFATSNS